MTIRALALVVLLLSGCSTAIHGTVQLVDSRQQPIPNESPKGAVVNMINTNAAVEQASASASVNEKGEFESPKDSIQPGLYKVEVSRIGYETQTQTIEVGSFGTRSSSSCARSRRPSGNRSRARPPTRTRSSIRARSISKRPRCKPAVQKPRNGRYRHACIPTAFSLPCSPPCCYRRCGERLDIEVKARLDGQPAAQAKVLVDREELGVTDAQGVLAKQISRKAGTELEVTVSKEAPGYRIEPWKTTFLVKLPKDGQANKVRFDADLKAMRYVVLRVNDKGAPLRRSQGHGRRQGRGRHGRQGRGALPLSPEPGEGRRARRRQGRLRRLPCGAPLRARRGDRRRAQPPGGTGDQGAHRRVRPRGRIAGA